MAYEFKRLSDVEIVETPADATNVLIEENGVIKKAPKTAVGGSGEATTVIKIVADSWDDVTADSITFEKGDISTLRADGVSNPASVRVVHELSRGVMTPMSMDNSSSGVVVGTSIPTVQLSSDDNIISVAFDNFDVSSWCLYNIVLTFNSSTGVYQMGFIQRFYMSEIGNEEM